MADEGETLVKRFVRSHYETLRNTSIHDNEDNHTVVCHYTTRNAKVLNKLSNGDITFDKIAYHIPDLLSDDRLAQKTTSQKPSRKKTHSDQTTRTAQSNQDEEMPGLGALPPRSHLI